MTPSKQLQHAHWMTPQSGVVHLMTDWTEPRSKPPLYWGADHMKLERLEKAPPLFYGDLAGYYTQDKILTFAMRADRYSQLEWQEDGLYVAGDFNGWDKAIGKKAWRMEPALIRGIDYYLLNVSWQKLKGKKAHTFKFVTGKGQWLEVPTDAPNAIYDETGNRNWLIHPDRSGHHVFFFSTPQRIEETGQGRVCWLDGECQDEVLMMPGDFLHAVQSDLPLGARIVESKTVFRLFAPRATRVNAVYYRKLDRSDKVKLPMRRVDSTVWEAWVEEPLLDYYYHFNVDSSLEDPHAHFDSSFRILDPYAMACVSAAGPGVIIDPQRLQPLNDGFQTPQWQDLVIAEAHVRDLVEKAPIPLTEQERKGFAGLRKWAQAAGFYLKELGVNCIELQPLQQNDAQSLEEYHWGYMTTNFFAPNCYYGSDIEKTAQIEELKALVKTLHAEGFAVIVDVVYNHVGEPNHLQYIDKRYYFELDEDGEFINWSGTGNTLRCNTPMARRLIIESLSHWLTVYGVDGFRFDLGELIGKETLVAVEAALKKVKPGVILITEPWSFRGHIAHALKDSGYASWNDGYREFVRKYLLGQEDAEGLKYYFNASLNHLTAWPAQTVNYVESHDDYCWMDRITENAESNGHHPTPNDRRRTHLLGSLLLMSLGMPMLSAGQDFLRSKYGRHNTYQAGDVNALDYGRQRYYSGTHDYFAAWIRFRLSQAGKLLRPYDRPQDDYLEFTTDESGKALAVLVNANGEAGASRLLYALNPTFESVELPVPENTVQLWTQLADAERLDPDGLETALLPQPDEVIVLSGLSCALWAGAVPAVKKT